MRKRTGLIITSLVLVFIALASAVAQPRATNAKETDEQRLFFPVVSRPFAPVLEPFVTGLDPQTTVTDLVDPGDGRLFIVLKDGRIQVSSADGVLQPGIMLDIQDRVYDNGTEMGLLGLATHPEFATNGHFYVYYTEMEEDGERGVAYFAVLARYIVDSNGVADPQSELRLMRFGLQTKLHHAGALQFGPLDGYLYVAVGDGGTDGAYSSYAQDKNNYLGKILRIDVNNGSPYAIPSDNPYVDDPNSLGEIWQTGLRNPWRISFDPKTGEMYIGDVGEFTWEEVNFVPAGSTGGENFGWPCMEGPVVFREAECRAAQVYTPPIFYFGHRACAAVTAGYVYHGSRIPSLKDQFLVADLCYGTLWSLGRDQNQVWRYSNFGDYFKHISTFGERSNGELVVGVVQEDTIYQLAPPN